MGAWHAIYGECLKSKGKNPSKSQKSACYNEATRALGERGGSRSSGKGGAMAKRKAGGSPGSHYKCKYGRLKTRTRGPNGGWRYCKKKPKCAKGARAQAKKVASGRSSAPYQRNTFQGPCRWGRLVSPVKLPGGGMRFCKLKPRDAQAAPARKQIDERRGPFHNIERMAAAAAAQAAAEQGEWQGPCQWGRLKTPVQEADGRMRHCKLRPMPSGWQDLIAKR